MDSIARRLDDATAELDRIREDKDQEIQILQESVDTTLQRMAEIQAVREHDSEKRPKLILCTDSRYRGPNHQYTVDHSYSE